MLPRSDCWEANDPGRDASGQLEPNPERFPAGMKALGDHMHSLGVSFGIYSDEGTRTCGGFQGSEGHEATDAKTFASWVRQPDGAAGRGRALPISSHAAFDGQGVDYLKLDGCYNDKAGYVPGCENPTRWLCRDGSC